MKKTKISWTDYNFNPFFGCTPTSRACKYCYACKIAKRGGLDFSVCRTTKQMDKDGIDKVLQPSMFFVNTMSDTFHKDFSAKQIKQVFDVMKKYPQHAFQVLTKRSKRMKNLSLDWTENIWAGVTVEHPDYKSRIDDLRQVPAKVKFLSIEPLLADLGELNLKGIDWVIIGGLSGVSKKTFEELGITQEKFEKWVRNVIRQAKKAKCKIFYKQGFGFRPEKEPFIDGKQYLEFPQGRKVQSK